MLSLTPTIASSLYPKGNFTKYKSIVLLVSVSSTKGGMRFDEKFAKWQLITTHTARRSAATNMYLAGIPTISIMKTTGHKTEKAFLKYIRISQEDNALKLMEHPYFKNSHLKVV